MSNKSNRPPLLASDLEQSPCLPDGRPAWQVARANGVPLRTFRQRLRRRIPLDRAVLPVGNLSPGGRPVGSKSRRSLILLPDGRSAWPVARAAGVASSTFDQRIRAGWSPERSILGSRQYGNGRPPAVWLDALTLPDGRSAVAVALASGVSRAQLRSRVLHKMPLVEAVNPKGVYRLADGRPALKVARSVGLSRGQFFKLLAAGQSPDAIIADALAAQAKRAVI